jgi:hypothetical protein
VESLLNKQSGLLGISGLTNDMRELLAEAEEHDDRRAWLAIEIFCYRVRKYLGAYLAAMGGADAICFAGGIGENAPRSAGWLESTGGRKEDAEQGGEGVWRDGGRARRQWQGRSPGAGKAPGGLPTYARLRCGRLAQGGRRLPR